MLGVSVVGESVVGESQWLGSQLWHVVGVRLHSRCLDLSLSHSPVVYLPGVSSALTCPSTFLGLLGRGLLLFAVFLWPLTCLLFAFGSAYVDMYLTCL